MPLGKKKDAFKDIFFSIIVYVKVRVLEKQWIVDIKKTKIMASGPITAR